ncbi:trypsin-like peptidase domain-containing protein [Streptomyces sp. MAR4 CNX-425]|uniref:trypsin-like peptidase domain-containing protein n=1 Tax=Streptomyces sp. MAR4 CNX-425 TaxID=3406343 RepID=UPI003B50606C
MSADPPAGGLDPHRIAEVITDSGAGGGSRGSGYLISADAVLTAAHVVAGAHRITVRCDADRPGEWSAPAVVAWTAAGSDLAVLTVTPPAHAPAAAVPARFGRVADDRPDVVDVHLAGFPLFKRRRHPDGAYFREMHQAHGSVAALSNLRTGTLEVTVPPPGADPDPAVSPWSGMSGAAVWAGDRVVGVIAEHHRAEGLNRLTAVRLDHALRGLDESGRAEFTRLLALPGAPELPLAVPGGPGLPQAEEVPPEVRVVGVPVAYGIELFKNRAGEVEQIARHLSDPAIRMVTVVGRRGIGKSALAAKIMDLLDRGAWPGPAAGGLVNLSTRTSGISLERLYFDCARLLGPAQTSRLHKVWEAGGPLEHRLSELFRTMGGRQIFILLDNLDDLLGDDGHVEDDELAVFLDWLFRTATAPRVLVTSQVPVRLVPELRRFAAHVELAGGLSPAESADLLRELDRDGSLGVAALSDDELLHAAVRVHGVPRALELLVGAVAEDAVPLPSLDDVLRDFTRRHDVVSDLAHARYERLDGRARGVLGVLAALRTPVTQRGLEEILAGIDPELPVADVLTALVRMRLVSFSRADRTLALHPLDADIALDQTSWHGTLGRQAVERRIASWYAEQTRSESEPRTHEDVELYRRRFDHLVRAGDHDGAARVLNEISEYLIWHGWVLAAVSMHLSVDGRIEDEEVRLAQTVAYGHARLSAGPMEQAVELFTAAVDLAERRGDRPALQYALFGLGDAHRQLAAQDAAVEPLARSAELARELGNAEREAHALLSLSLTHSYLRNGESALAGADRLTTLAAASGDPLTVARAGNARTIALLTLERWRETVESGSETVRAYRAAGVREATAYALNAQGLAFVALAEPGRAVTVLEDALREASLMENPRAEGVCLLNLAWACWCDGADAESAATADRAAAALTSAGAAQAEAARLLAEAARTRANDPGAAADTLDHAATYLDGNAEVVTPDWFTDEARRLRGDR